MEFLTEQFINRTVFALFALNEYLTRSDIDLIAERYAALFRVNGFRVEEFKNVFRQDVFFEGLDERNTYHLSRMSEAFPEKFSPYEHHVIKAMVSQAEAVKKLRSEEDLPGLCFLEHTGSGGDAKALCLLAFLLKNGIVMKKDPDRAKQLIENAADYHFLDALIMFLSDEEDEYYSSALHTVLSDSSVAETYSLLCRTTKASTAESRFDPFSKAFERLFNEKILSRTQIGLIVGRDAAEHCCALNLQEEDCYGILRKAIELLKRQKVTATIVDSLSKGIVQTKKIGFQEVLP